MILEVFLGIAIYYNIFLMKKTLMICLVVTPHVDHLTFKKKIHPSGFKVRPMDDADEPW